jgi:DNA-binding CsgD family transcriptional regulator
MREAERLRAALSLLSDPFLSYPELTERERKVMSLAFRGYDATEIAGRLAIGRKTVYRDMLSVAGKVSKQDGQPVAWNDLVKKAHLRLERALAMA